MRQIPIDCHSLHDRTWTDFAPAPDINCRSLFAWSECGRYQLPVVLHMVKLGQVSPLHPTACQFGGDQTWTDYAPLAEINCLSFFTWSNLDRLRPCSRHQLPVIVHMVKLAATAADTNCLSFFTWSNLDRLRPCNRHELPVIVHTINSEPLQLTSTACHFAHDQTQSQCSRHQLPVILHMTKLGQPASLQKAHSHYLASVQ